jgi:hypothetical protein
MPATSHAAVHTHAASRSLSGHLTTRAPRAHPRHQTTAIQTQPTSGSATLPLVTKRPNQPTKNPAQHSSRRSRWPGSTLDRPRRANALVKTYGQIWWEHASCVNPPSTPRSPALLPEQPTRMANAREQPTALNRIQRIPTAPNCTALTSKSRIHAGQGAAVDIVHTEALHEPRRTALNGVQPQVNCGVRR